MRSQRPREPIAAPSDWEKRYFIWASGVYPKEFRERELKEHYQREAEQYPRIPAWIGNNPPLETVFVPNGEVLTYGPLGLHYVTDKSDRFSYRPNEGETWYRYTSEGKLLETYTPRTREHPHSARWQEVYADWEALEESLRSQGITNFYLSDFPDGGRAIVRFEHVADPDRPNHMYSEPQDLLAAYDFAGNPLDPDTPLAHTEWRRTTTMSRDHLQKIYAAQLELGLTDPATTSPWAGTPQGPVSVDPTPRPPRRFARRNRNVQMGAVYRNQFVDAVEVKSLENPANPYRDQYGPWDHWLFDNFGKNDPVMNARMNEQYQKQEEEIRKAKKEGRKPDPKIMMESYEPDFSNPWKHYNVMVDDEGFQIPHIVTELEQRQHLHSIANARDFRQPPDYGQEPGKYFEYYSGGVMPPEMLAEMESQLKANTPLQPIPAVPDWLVAAPPYAVIFVPNGEVLTHGAPGSWQENWRDLPKEQRRPADGWYRFSADGEELGRIDGQLANFQVYNPMLASLEMSGMSQGYQIDKPAGFLIWRRPREQGGEVVAAWDYDGTPLAIDQPIRRRPGYLHHYPWEQVKFKLEEEKSRAAVASR